MKSGVLSSPQVLRIGAIAIVLVGLFLVLVSILDRQKQEGARVAGVRNLQQWGIALNLCLIENGNQLPEVGKSPVTSSQAASWFNLLPPYISEKPLAELPPGERPRPGVPSIWIRPGIKPVKIWDPEVFFFSYGMNRSLQPVEGTRSFRISEISFPGHVIFLAPTEGYSPDSEPGSVVCSDNKKLLAHILFCDGHVEAVPCAKLLDSDSLAASSAENGISWFQK